MEYSKQSKDQLRLQSPHRTVAGITWIGTEVIVHGNSRAEASRKIHQLISEIEAIESLNDERRRIIDIR